jgi:hypothetical protein
VKALVALGSSVVTDATPPVTITTAAPKSADGKTVTVDTTGMKAGTYLVTVVYTYLVDPGGTTMTATKQVKLIVTP